MTRKDFVIRNLIVMGADRVSSELKQRAGWHLAISRVGPVGFDRNAATDASRLRLKINLAGEDLANGIVGCYP